MAQVAKAYNLLVISDEAYAELTYGIEHTSIANLPGMQERTILLNGFSKMFAMTGWRLGFAAGPEELIDAMLRSINIPCCAHPRSASTPCSRA